MASSSRDLGDEQEMEGMKEGGWKKREKRRAGGRAGKGSTTRRNIPGGRTCYAPGAAALLIRTVVLIMVARHDDVGEVGETRWKARQGGSGGWEKKRRPAYLWLWRR